MNNNAYRNNFNYPYSGANTYVNTEVNNSYMDMNNCYYNLSSNTNNIFYEINNPYTQLFFQMNNKDDNDNDNENKNVTGGLVHYIVRHIRAGASSPVCWVCSVGHSSLRS